jgi:hypothetical protein
LKSFVGTEDFLAVTVNARKGTLKGVYYNQGGGFATVLFNSFENCLNLGKDIIA